MTFTPTEVPVKKGKGRKQEKAPQLFPDDTAGATDAARYEVLPSVWYGDDPPLLERMLSFYPRKPPQRILDATVNKGRFWVGSSRPVVGMDIDPRHEPDVVGDCTDMPFADRSFDVVVYDPPHVPNQGRDKAKDFTTRFGLGGKSSAANGYNFSHRGPSWPDGRL